MFLAVLISLIRGRIYNLLLRITFPRRQQAGITWAPAFTHGAPSVRVEELNEVHRVAPSQGYRDSKSIPDRFPSVQIFQPHQRQMLNLCSEYLALFDSELKMIDYNRSATNSLSDRAMPKKQMVQHFLGEYFPDVEASEEFQMVHSEGGSYTVDAYQLNGFNLDSRVHCALTVFRVDSITVVMGEDTTLESEYAHKLNECIARFERLEEDHRVLLKALDLMASRQEEHAREIERRCRANIQSIIQPLVSQLKFARSSAQERELIKAIEAGINRITDNFSLSLQRLSHGMTPREIEIANLIRDGKATKEIAKLLNLGTKTVDFHRRNLRRKMGIANQSVNLRSSLLHADDIRYS